MPNAMRPQYESHVPIACATDGRTDATKKSHPYESRAEVSNVRARIGDDIATIGELLTSGSLWMTDERHPVVRSGQRDEILSHVRAAVWFSDRGKCELCGAKTPSGQPWHLDHITPWSAGGSDDTTNLRVLCEWHNVNRSNRVDPTERPRRAATWWCLRCYSNEGFPWTYAGDIAHCGIHNLDASHHNPYRCRVVRYQRAHIERQEPVPTWHKRRPIVSASVVAYCAHCNAPGLTDVPL